jgi:hypothetical protein
MEFYGALMRVFGVSLVEFDWNDDNPNLEPEGDQLPFTITPAHFENNFTGSEDDIGDDDDNEAQEFCKATLEWWNK